MIQSRLITTHCAHLHYYWMTLKVKKVELSWCKATNNSSLNDQLDMWSCWYDCNISDGQDACTLRIGWWNWLQKCNVLYPFSLWFHYFQRKVVALYSFALYFLVPSFFALKLSWKWDCKPLLFVIVPLHFLVLAGA